MAIEFYEYDGTEYQFVGAIEDGEVTTEALDWIPEWIDETDDPKFGGDIGLADEEAVVNRLSNEYFMGVITDNGEREMSSPGRALEDWEQAYDDIFERVVWDDSAPERQLFEFDPEDVPQFAIENLREAVLAGALFEDIDGIPSSAREAVKATMLDSLEARHGWSVDSIAENLQNTVPELDAQRAETIARTETAAITNSAREIGYEKRLDMDEARFYWQGPENQRTTEACSWLKRQTNPQFGGEPVSLSRLKELIDEAPAHDDGLADDIARPKDKVVHPNERHTWVRATGAV